MHMKSLVLGSLLALAPLSTFADTAKETAVTAMSAVFIDRDVVAIKNLFAEDYIQHNPQFPNGIGTLLGFAENMPKDLSYQIGNVHADADTGLVAIHFRVVGFGPKPLIGVDILRIEDGIVREHWDVLQEEVTETVSGNPMWTTAID